MTAIRDGESADGLHSRELCCSHAELEGLRSHQINILPEQVAITTHEQVPPASTLKKSITS
jgi:hypothetical protein